MLCNLREQMPGCGLLSADRHNCRLVMHNSTDKHFTMVRPLARSVIIATRATRIREMPQQTIGKPRPARIVTIGVCCRGSEREVVIDRRRADRLACGPGRNGHRFQNHSTGYYPGLHA
ncbi:hypothetical protein OSTOST_14906 [Ostertagia ostertagi]